MHKINNITAEPFQEHTLILADGEAVVELRFLPAVEIWTPGCERTKDKERAGQKLSANVYHLRPYNFPFDFTVVVNDGSGT